MITIDFDKLTREDVEQIHAEQGTGCKWCESPTTEDGWWDCGYDIYCFGCALKLNEELGVEGRLIPTREQVETWAAWQAMGIGIN
jgi:hypothetical protein